MNILYLIVSILIILSSTTFLLLIMTILIISFFYIRGYYIYYYKINKLLVKNNLNLYNNKRIILILEKNKYDKYLFSNSILPLLKKINYKTDIIENLNSKDFENILLNNNIKEIYIFGHGKRCGIKLNDIFYDYEKIFKLNITPKDVICAFHCGSLKKCDNKEKDILTNFAYKVKKFNKNIFFFESWWWIKFNFKKFYFSNKRK